MSFLLNDEDNNPEIGGYVTIVDTRKATREVMIWGIGQDEDEAYADACKNFREYSWDLRIYPCSKALIDFTEKHGGEKATKRCFLHIGDEYADLMPDTDTVEEFCNKHSLSPQAREELFKIADFPMNFVCKVED